MGTITQASSKPKLFIHELLFKFPLYIYIYIILFIIYFYFFMIPNIMSCEQYKQNKIHMCVFMILLLWWFISLLWVSQIVVVVVVMLCMWGLGFLCFMKVPIVKVSQGFTSP
jgi:hypothetical protein